MKPHLLPLHGLLCIIFTYLCGCDAPPPPDSQNTVTGRVVGVHDGDSITVLIEPKEQLKIRLDGIDAPELSQPQGQKSKASLSGLVMSRSISLETKGTDRYGRTLAVVKINGMNVNREMVRLGYAWHFVRYSKDAALAAAENEARTARRGVWATESPIPPWDWRKK